MKQRDDHVDVAKGICMLLIVCIHTEVFGVIGMPLTFIAVPMFFFMSGFYDRSEKPLMEWFSKSFRTLILPAIIWCVIGYLYLGALQYIKTKTFPAYNFDIYNQCTGDGPAWFLWALLYAKFVTWIIEKVKIPLIIKLILTYLLGYIGSKYQLPLLLDEGMAAVPLYYSGKLIYSYLKKVIFKRYVVIVCIFSLLMLICGYVYYDITPTGNGNYTPCYVVAIVLMEIVFLLVLMVSEKLKRLELLQKIGRNSLGIMLTHALMCHTAAVTLNRLFLKGSSEWITCFLIAYIVIVMMSYYLTIVIEKHLPILLGKRNNIRV